MAKKDEARDNVTYWRLKSGVHFEGAGKNRRRFNAGDVIEFGPDGPPAAFRDKFDRIDNPRVEVEAEGA